MLRERNNFDALRLLGALLVIVGHSFILVGAGPAPRIAGIPIHTLGVVLFFAISGHLIAASAAADPRPRAFLVKRALRIYPALAVTVLVTTFVIGPVMSSHPLPLYFSDDRTAGYLSNLIFRGSYELPGVFDTEVHARTAVNGSLWTLGIEVACYLGVIAAVISTRRRPAMMYASVAVASASMSTLAPWPASTSEVIAIFFCSAAMGSTIPPEWMRPYVGCLSLIGSSVVVSAGGLYIFAIPLFCYGVIAIGRASTPVVRSIGRRRDLSYGLYLWGYPVQQIVIGVLPLLPLVDSLMLTLAVSGTLALASWRFVEAPALRMRSRFTRSSRYVREELRGRIQMGHRSTVTEILATWPHEHRPTIATTFRQIDKLGYR